MPDYAAMYKLLFNSQTTAIEILQKAQQDAEAMYMNAPETAIALAEHRAPEGEPGRDE